MDIVLVRHGEPVRIVGEDEAGPAADPPLTPRGRAQAEAAAAWLASESFDALYASPLRRAVETAAPIADALGLEVQPAEGVAEYDRGSASYIPYEELKRTRDEHWQALVEDRLADLIPDGAAFRPRVAEAMEVIIAKHPGQRVCVVCHGGVINVFLAEVLRLDRDLWCEVAYASISRVAAARSGERGVISVNETGHLRSLERV